ncbi:uncharacterized protein TNCV_1765971 [Trichonephila clavipes]|nr:uncharacterized protein TNCV_1765971 [Trichonephila clavipes]
MKVCFVCPEDIPRPFWVNFQTSKKLHGLVVKKLPSSSVSPSGPPTEDCSNAPTHEALDNAYQHIQDLEKQVALSEGKLQESQRYFDSPSSPSLATHRSLLHQQLFPPPPNEKVLLVRPLEPNAGSSTTRNKITSFLLSKNLPFRITRIKNINNGGIAICLTTDEDVCKLSQELSNNADFASFSISKPVRLITTPLILADLRILQLNANHSRSAHLQAHSVAVEMGFDLLLLQDPYPKFNLPLNSPLGSCQFFSNSLNCAVVCYNRNTICNFRMKTDHTVSINIKLNQVFLTVINVYFPPHGDFSEANNQLNLYKGINKNCLLAGDFNARSVVWGYKNTDRRGDILTDFLLSNNLNLCNIPGLGPTFHGPRSAVGNPDLTLTSCDLISFVVNWEILSTESLSDHSFISVHLRCDLTFSDFVFKTKYGINKFIYNFRKNYNLLNSFLTNISSIELLDDFASLLINTTNASAFSTLRKRRVLNTPSFKWWNNSLRIQRNQLNSYKWRVVSLTTHGMSVDEIASMRSRYKALRANYKKSIIDTKNKAWEYFCSTNSNNFRFTFKAAFGKLSSPTNLHQISTGDPASLFHSKVSLLLDSHFPSGSSPIPLVFNDCSPPSCLSPSEVEVVFRSFVGVKPRVLISLTMLFGKLFITPSPTYFFDSLTSASN